MAEEPAKTETEEKQPTKEDKSWTPECEQQFEKLNKEVEEYFKQLEKTTNELWDKFQAEITAAITTFRHMTRLQIQYLCAGNRECLAELRGTAELARKINENWDNLKSQFQGGSFILTDELIRYASKQLYILLNQFFPQPILGSNLNSTPNPDLTVEAAGLTGNQEEIGAEAALRSDTPHDPEDSDEEYIVYSGLSHIEPTADQNDPYGESQSDKKEEEEELPVLRWLHVLYRRYRNPVPLLSQCRMENL